MGHPKKQRKKTSKPFRPYDKDRIEREKKIMKEFGLHRKQEIRRAEALLRNFRRRARKLQAVNNTELERILFEKLSEMGLSSEKLEDILELKLEHILSRRLQTIVYKKGLSKTVKHARQLIVHGHIIIDNNRVRWPGHLVPVEKENDIHISEAVSS
jgi:small subunit ribosomal protein S4